MIKSIQTTLSTAVQIISNEAHFSHSHSQFNKFISLNARAFTYSHIEIEHQVLGDSLPILIQPEANIVMLRLRFMFTFIGNKIKYICFQLGVCVCLVAVRPDLLKVEIFKKCRDFVGG